MKKRYIRSIISIVLCFALVTVLMMVSNVEAAEKTEGTEPILEYVMIDNPSITTPGTQKIVVGYNKGTVLSGATLRYKNTISGEEYSVEATEIQDAAVVFEMSYEDESWTGRYSLEGITYIVNGQELSLNFEKCGIEGKFAVNQICETEPDAIIEGERTEDNVNDADVSFTTITQDGTVREDENIADVINDAIEVQSNEPEVAAYAEGRMANFVVVLDPGHGGFDPGTSGQGANEKSLTLKIAKYCKEELEKDGRIQVYMTRETDTGVGGAQDVSTDLKNRISFAVSKKANLFVSIHLNAASSNAYGAEVYYPNSNYRPEIGEKGQKLASSIQKQLVSLGLYNRGVKVSNSQNSKYPDGSVQDYYYVIQQSKRNGFPGIIVEHAFLSNASDYQKYLSSDEKLKALGEADAKGIIEYINSNENLGNWELEGNQWKYVYADGTYVKDRWLNLNGIWYHFDVNGFMQTGWITIGNTSYYLDGSGAMVTGWLNLDGTWYYLNGSGAMVTGWLNLNGVWYYLNSDGKMATGWLDLNGTWYYLNGSGAMVTGWLYENGIWYYLNAGGARVSNCWMWIGNKCYYFDQEGKMASNTWVGDSYVNSSGAWVPGKKKPVDHWIISSGRWWYCHSDGSYTRSNWEYIGNQWYYFDNSGWMVTGWLNLNGTWYYLNGSGAMATGWLNLNGTWYYLNASGAMASNIWIGDYYFNASGAWVPGKKKEEIQEKDQWINSSGRWWYRHADGSYTRSNWEIIGSQKYYFDENGWMVTGYKQIAGIWYYFQKGVSPEGALTYTGVTSIMGNSDMGNDENVVVNKMVKMFQKSGRSYPADKLAVGGADTIEKFCQIVYTEAIKEGVKPEIVFGQAMKETGYLQFGKDVKIEQFNFAGLGATGGGANGADFRNVETGIRAQVQHLKAYASKDGVVQDNVDPRFEYVVRESAIYVEWLGQKENPTGKGWATAWNYGISLMNQYIRPMYTL